MEQLGSDADKADAEDLAAEFDEDNPIKIKKQKKTMCENVQKKKLWKEDGIDLKTIKGDDKHYVITITKEKQLWTLELESRDA